MQKHFPKPMVFALSTIFLLCGVAVGAHAQSAKALPNDVIAANQGAGPTTPRRAPAARRGKSDGLVYEQPRVQDG